MITTRKRRGRVSAALALTALLGGTLALAGTSAATAEPAVRTSAYGIQILDIDGGQQQAPAPLSEWAQGDTVSQTLESTTDFFRLNTTRSEDLRSRAASDGAAASVGHGLFQLRDRPAVEFSGLEVSCTTDGSTRVSFDSLTVNGTDVLAGRDLTETTRYDLPSSMYGATRLVIGERGVDAANRTTATALRIEAEAGASEIWRIRLGVVSCGEAPEPEPEQQPITASGVTVTGQDGSTLINRQPRVSGSGQVTADRITADGFPATATGVSVEQRDDGSATVSIDSFEQIPDTSSIGEYMWSALRVYGLTLTVSAQGDPEVSFARSGNAVFANGVWINTGTDLYTGLDPQGNPRIRIHLGEKVVAEDGTA
ncbi:MAG: hypothetical protein ACTJHU_00685, partial [Mycetocola sp.]